MVPNTLSACEKSPVFVNSVGMIKQLIPAFLADRNPRSESSIATHSSFRKPLFSTARRYGLGIRLEIFVIVSGENKIKVLHKTRRSMDKFEVLFP